jgi:RND family efflux transporter MFP subunit
MKGRMTLVLFVLTAAVLLFAGFPFFRKAPETSFIDRVGVIEATEIHISSKIAERIKELSLNEGDAVHADEVVIKLDDREIGAEVAQAEANVQRGEAGLLSAEAQIEKARANLQDADRNLRRIAELRQENVVSLSEMDKAQTRFDLARAELKAMEAEAGSSKAELKQREANLRLVQIRLQEATLYAPISGIVTLKAYEIGEMTQPGAPILTLIDPESVWARINLEEGDIAKVRLGNRVEVFVDSLPGRSFEGKVAEVGSEGGFATQRDVTRGKQDIKTFRVKAQLASSQGFLKPGMTAKVRIYFNDEGVRVTERPR